MAYDKNTKKLKEYLAKKEKQDFKKKQGKCSHSTRS